MESGEENIAACSSRALPQNEVITIHEIEDDPEIEEDHVSQIPIVVEADDKIEEIQILDGENDCFRVLTTVIDHLGGLQQEEIVISEDDNDDNTDFKHNFNDDDDDDMDVTIITDEPNNECRQEDAVICKDDNSNMDDVTIVELIESDNTKLTSNDIVAKAGSSAQVDVQVTDFEINESTSVNTAVCEELETADEFCGEKADNEGFEINEGTSVNTDVCEELEKADEFCGEKADNEGFEINEGTPVNTDVCEGSETTDEFCQEKACRIDYEFNQTPYQITGAWKEFASTNRHNFTRGCKWAPDGSCILTCSDDNALRIFNLPQELWDSSQWSEIHEMEVAVKIVEGDLIYDYTWYPLMKSSDPATCCLASVSRKSTVHLWDGFTGELRCSYRAYNHMDEIATPHSLNFDADGQRLFCGFEKVVRIFNVDMPGRYFEERRVYEKKSGHAGIISCFAFTSVDKNISAAGSYQKTIGIYSEPDGELTCILEGHRGGITQLQFSPDGSYLYSAGRKDPEIFCWDLRNLGSVLFSLRRSNVTNQRMYFDVSSCGRYVTSGNQNGVITVWDVTKKPKLINENEHPILEPIQFFLAHDDCVNGVSLHPTYPLLCSTSGQRKFPPLLGDEEEGIFSPKLEKWDNSLRLWWIGK